MDDATPTDTDREARRAALGQLLDEWDRELGPVPEADLAEARAAFAELDG